jgi:hypothetical protein
MIRQISLSEEASMVIECGVIAGIEELHYIWWLRGEHDVWEQFCNFLLIPNLHHWCSDCVATGQIMGGELLRYCKSKDGCHHLLVSIEKNKVKVVVFKQLRNKKKMILCIWEGVDSAILT